METENTINFMGTLIPKSELYDFLDTLNKINPHFWRIAELLNKAISNPSQHEVCYAQIKHLYALVENERK